MGVFGRFFGSASYQQMAAMSEIVSREVSLKIAEKIGQEFSALAEVENATARVVELQKELAGLHAEKANIEEGFARKEREVEHKTGLLRQEIDAEQRQSQKDFELRVVEAKLDAKAQAMAEKEKVFAEKMAFIETRFTDEVGYLKAMVKNMSDRLPDATILATKVL